jgi:hypothetical protein
MCKNCKNYSGRHVDVTNTDNAINTKTEVRVMEAYWAKLGT